jgi:hypothetical protein
MPLINVLGILVVGCTGVILPLHTALFGINYLHNRNDLSAIKMSRKEEVTNGSEKVEGIRLKRTERLLLVMNTPKGAV